MQDAWNPLSGLYPTSRGAACGRQEVPHVDVERSRMWTSRGPACGRRDLPHEDVKEFPVVMNKTFMLDVWETYGKTPVLATCK